MPELPEVETTTCGIRPHIAGQRIRKVIIRHKQLRWPIPSDLAQQLERRTVLGVTRRGKYILLLFKHGTAILHLGMSGHLRVVSAETPARKHDHVDILFANDCLLRFNDPRRFGALLWTGLDYQQHTLLKNLGVEPLTTAFSGRYLFAAARSRKVPIKSLVMDARVVVGVGNIYANEALFAAAIHPLLPACALTLIQAQQLVAAIKKILRGAIKAGGTTLSDFLQADGKPGYFRHLLVVYGRAGQPCVNCNNFVQVIRLAQRSTFFCQHCQVNL